VDNGGITVPTVGIYTTNSQWTIEGHGVDPDIEVVDDPGAMAKGHDPQTRTRHHRSHERDPGRPTPPAQPAALSRSVEVTWQLIPW